MASKTTDEPQADGAYYSAASGPAQINLLAKWQAALCVTSDPRMSAGDIAVLLQILDYYSVERGYAWPAMDTMAANIGRSKRGVVNSVQKLTASGYLQIISHGGRSHSNRYRPVFKEYTRAAARQDIDPTTVNHSSPNPARDTVQSSVTVGAISCKEMVNHSSPDSYHYPGQEAGGSGGGESDDSPDAAPTPPDGGSGLASVKGGEELRYPEFWAVYPKKRDPVNAEKAIDAALADGVGMDTIIDGARRYSAYVEAQPWGHDPRFTKKPANWIKDARWLDDWTVEKKKPAKAKAKKAPAKGKSKAKQAPAKGKAKTSTKATKTRAPAKATTGAANTRDEKYERLERECVTASQRVRAHRRKCDACTNHFNGKGKPCGFGGMLFTDKRDTAKKLNDYRGNQPA